MKKSFSVIGRILSTLLIIGELIVILVLVFTRLSGGIPSVFGHTFSIVVTPSMEPTIKTGDIILSKLYDGNHEFEIDDIITFTGRGEETNGLPITHRVIEVNKENKTLVTKGDANNIADDEIQYSDVMAVMEYKTVILGPIYRAINSAPGFLLLVVLPILAVIAIEIVSFVKAAKSEIKGENK